jgi:hypothetical protein
MPRFGGGVKGDVFQSLSKHQSLKFFQLSNLFFKFITFGVLFQAVSEGITYLK